MIPYGKQDINQEDIDAVIEVLKSDYLTQGPKVPEFESVVASYCGAQHGVAVNSATSALHIACMALDIGPGDIVWTSPISFVASANCVLYCGGTVDFVDIDPETFNMSIECLTEKLQLADREGRLPKAIIAVHMAGQSCDMKAISDLARQYGFKVIEDASHAIGGSYQGKKVGCCEYSDLTVFSFHPVKIITSAEGGMVMTNSEDYAQKLRLYRSHGITRDPDIMTEAPHGDWYYQQITLGYNYRMNDIQAALGNSQMKRLDGFVAKRTEIAEYYDEKLQGLPIKLPRVDSVCESSWHLYIIQLKDSMVEKHQDIFGQLRQSGVGVQLHYIPIHMQPFFKHRQIKPSRLIASERYYNASMSLPLYTNLDTMERDEVVVKLVKLANNFAQK